MNKILLIFLFTTFASLSSFAQKQDPVALIINGKSVLRSELESAYKKASDQKALEEKSSFSDFLYGYINLKLNVEEAKAQHLDTMSSYKRELSSARLQMSYKYMENAEYENKYIEKIYDRMQENVEINHVLIPFDKEKIFPSDTVSLYKQAMELRKKLLKDGFSAEGYSKKENSATGMVADYNRINGYVGWIAPFMFVSKVEDAIYNLSINEISQPIRSQLGYHIVQILNRRPAVGSVEVEQVLFGFNHIPAPQNQIDSVREVAWREYNNIRSESDYKSLCEEFSEVMKTGDKGCYLGVVSLGSSMPPSFLSAAFSLQNPGDISQPVLTDYGFHIIRLLNKIPVPEFSEMKKSLRNKILNSDKSVNISDAKREQMKLNIPLDINVDAYKKLNEIANTVSPKDSVFIQKISNGRERLFTIDGKINYTVNNFIEYIRFRNKQLNKEIGEEPDMIQFIDMVKHNLSTDQLNEYFKSYYSRILSDYYYSTLEDRFPDFDRQIREFSDELLVFAVKNKNIWDRSKTDEKGLINYFNKNRSKYKLDTPKYKGFIVFSKDEKSLEKAKVLAKETPDKDTFIQKVKDIFNKNGVTVQIEPGSWEKGDNAFVDNEVFGGSKPVLRRDFPHFFVTGKFIDSPEDYDDVRAAVEIDYQMLLEKEWESYLKNKYNVKIEKSVLETIQ